MLQFLCISLLFQTIATISLSTNSVHFYVSPHGDNTNPGTSSEFPFATLSHAKQHIHDLLQHYPYVANQNHNQPPQCKFVINLMNGTFYSTNPLQFNYDNIQHCSITLQSFNPQTPATISGGQLIPSSCWQSYSTNSNITVYACDLSQNLANFSLNTKYFHSITINNKRAIPARFPKLIDNDIYVGPQMNGWLFVNYSHYLNNSQFRMGINKNKLSNNFQKLNKTYNFGNGKIHIFPTRSWINFEVDIVYDYQYTEYISNSTKFSKNKNKNKNNNKNINGKKWQNVRNDNNNSKSNNDGVDIDVVDSDSDSDSDTDDELMYFIVTCPNGECSQSSLSSSIGSGNRFYLYNISMEFIPITQPNEWYFDLKTCILYIGISNVQNTNTYTNKNTNANIDDNDNGINVVIPNSNSIINLIGNSTHFVSDMTFKNIIFTDSDYYALGFQDTFNTNSIKPATSGIPFDPAIKLYYTKNITIDNCTFIQLGGTAIGISYFSNDIKIRNNYINHIGESGISLIGNSTIQSRGIIISGNYISNIGEILASAGGIYASTMSNGFIMNNTIINGSRWGIHVRSQSINAISSNITIMYNKINNMGLKTRDFGGISLMGVNSNDYTANSVIKYNCVKNMMGIDTNTNGKFEYPYFSWGIYLDNWSSGYYVFGNIVYSNVNTGIFIHGGHNNKIINNIFYNTSHYNTKIFSQLQFGQVSTGSMLPYNNSVLKNVWMWYNQSSLNLIGYSGAGGGGNKWNDSFAREIDYNIWYNPFVNIANVSVKGLTPLSDTWQGWIDANNGMYSKHSIVDQDPGFLNPKQGNFEWNVSNSDSPMNRVGFESIPSYIANDC